MKAMIFEGVGKPLRLMDVPVPSPAKGQVKIQVQACAVCRTDLHIIDGELPKPKLPLILGHQIVGTVSELGEGVTNLKIGQKVGVPWLGKSCGHCKFCLSNRENLCDNAIFTGYTIDGGFAEYCVAYAAFCFPLPTDHPPTHQAPLLCGGLIGYRAYRMAEKAKRIGFYGFGSSAHMLIQVAAHEKREIYAFTRKGDSKGQQSARNLGAVWAGHSEEYPPEKLDAAIIFAPVGSLMTTALRALDKGGSVISAGIHMSDIPSFPYADLWEERIMRSVANLTRQDGREFLPLAFSIPIKTQVSAYPLKELNQAVEDLRHGKFQGTAVINMEE
jgi:alcohol dehydrogenase, propanol-preferring